jgi:hypothetical protein
LQAVGECNRESSAVPDDAGANAGGQAGKLGWDSVLVGDADMGLLLSHLWHRKLSLSCRAHQQSCAAVAAISGAAAKHSHKLPPPSHHFWLT